MSLTRRWLWCRSKPSVALGMTVYEKADLHSLIQDKAQGKTLSEVDNRSFEYLFAKAEAEEEREAARLPRPFKYGGDYLDAF